VDAETNPEAAPAMSVNATSDMSTQTITAMVRTTPFFDISNAQNAVGQSVMVLGVEPKFTGTKENPQFLKTHSWFSGVYNIFGFRHTISQSDVSSEFSVTRTLGIGGLIDVDPT